VVPCQPRAGRRSIYWLLLAIATSLFTLEPSFALVVITLGLALLAALWSAMLIGVVVKDILHPFPEAEPGAHPEPRRGSPWRR